ncbi:Lacal_2735 family protein [Draconibacterium sediminis]|uniref:Lacal_2735 family protein n=1 Tax=Draconibacterium sediminis TaxID=1544798 RepID=UPI0012FA0974|nr:Lacal_2735 family protein [Draconibacterium sediminis]
MFNIFKKDPAKRLQKQYDKLMEENYHLSKTNRKLADQKYAEAEAVMQKIIALKQQDK